MYIQCEDIQPSEIFYFEDDKLCHPSYTRPGWYFWDNINDDVLVGPFENVKNAEIALNIFKGYK